MTQGPYIAGAVAFLLVLGGIWYFFQPGGPGPVACPADAMLCPDGSYVGRTGSSCQFVCPEPAVPTSGGTGGVAVFDSGIRGVAMVGPTCPVERDPPDPQCADKPLATNVLIYRSGDLMRPVIITTSDKAGKFEADLPPGEYVVRGGEAVLPRCADTPASVAAGAYTTVTLNCDSGIR